MDIDATDAFLFSQMGVQDTPFSFGASADTAGSVAYTMLAAEADIKLGAAIGDVAPFDAGAQSSGNLIRGTILLNSKGTPLTATGGGTGLQLRCGQRNTKNLRRHAHTRAGTGSVTAKLQSDATMLSVVLRQTVSHSLLHLLLAHNGQAWRGQSQTPGGESHTQSAAAHHHLSWCLFVGIL